LTGLPAQADNAKKGGDMNTLLAYLISIGIVGFGALIAATLKASGGTFPISIVMGMLIILAGMVSLLHQICNSRRNSLP
jgi:hypothetical protein